MKYILLLLLFPLFIIAQTPAEKESYKNRDKYLFAARPVQKKFLRTIPFDGKDDQIVVPVIIGGETYHFLFDTGAATVISEEIAARLALKPLFKNNIVDGSGTVQEEPFYSMPNVQFGGVEFKNMVAIVSDMKKFETLYCVKIDGLLGTNIMRTCHWKIDYTNGVITMSDKAIKPEGNFYAVDFKESFSGSPVLELFMGDYSVSMLMDTGYNGGYSIPDSLYFKSRKNHERPFKKGYGTTMITLFENDYKERYMGIVDSVYIANKRHLVLNGVADIDHADTFLMGNDIFKGFGEVILDWKKRRIYLPEKVVDANGEYNTFGFAPVYKDGNVTVSIVWEGSNAFKHGIESGDAVTAINGQNTVDIDSGIWCGILEQIRGKTASEVNVSLLKKDGSTIICTLKRTNILQ
jgi:predicted aspartyl protease